MKKTSILSLLWLAGFFAFSAPIFAQETEEVADVDDAAIVADVAEDVAAEDVAAVEEEADTSFEDAIKNDPEAVAQLNDAMDQFLDGLDLSEEDRAELEANFPTPEDRAVVTAVFWTILAGAGLVYLIIAGIWFILLIIALWKAFTKAVKLDGKQSFLSTMLILCIKLLVIKAGSGMYL